MLEKAASERKDVVLMGDLICNLLEAASSVAKELMAIPDEYHMAQLISEPMRTTAHFQSLIDVLFTTNIRIFFTSGTAVLTGIDHLMIYGECAEKVTCPAATVSYTQSFKKCDMEALISDLANAP